AGRYAKTLLEVQHYPSLPLFPGGPLKPPYDITAHTLPLQMGVEVVRIETPFHVRSRRLAQAPCAGGGLGGGSNARLFLVGAETNSSARVVNRLLAHGARVSRSQQSDTQHGRMFPPGTYVVQGIDDQTVRKITTACGVAAFGVSGLNPP